MLVDPEEGGSIILHPKNHSFKNHCCENLITFSEVP
jgi:hypothetical protein